MYSLHKHRTIDPAAENLAAGAQKAYTATHELPSMPGQYAVAGSASSGLRDSHASRAAAGHSKLGHDGAMTRDFSLASLDKLSLPGPGHYETNVSSCVSTEATRKLKNDA